MRGTVRRSHQEEEEESAFVSMTDMTVSFLFIVMILLAYFATQFRDEDTVARPIHDALIVEKNVIRVERDEAVAELSRLGALLLQRGLELDAARAELATTHQRVAELEAEIQRLRLRLAELEAQLQKLELRDPLEVYLTQAAQARLRILESLRDRIRVDFPNLLIEISAESDALRFQGEGLFRSGESVLRDEPRRIVETIAGRLNEILPCYSFGAALAWDGGCNPTLAIIEAVQIEGHTDSMGAMLSNLTLSTARANATFASMVQRQPDLTDHLNYRGQPVLSVAGYGQMRPVATNDTREGRATNRRIDLRIIMHTPSGSDEIDRIRAQLRAPTERVP